MFPVTIHDISLTKVRDDILTKKINGIVVTPNVDHMCRIYSDSSFKTLYTNADLCVCDSKILQLISILKKQKICNVVRGSDLTVELLKHSKNNQVLIVGSDSNQPILLSKIFGLKRVQHFIPSFGFVDKPQELQELVSEICREDWDIAFLAVGSPQQEILAHMIKNKIELSDRTIICCGNAINFAVNNVKRSPNWMSNIGLEWLFRIIMEPKRMLPRYLKNISIFYYMFFKDDNSET